MYEKLLHITRRLSAAQNDADWASEKYRAMDLRSTSGTRRASANDRLVAAAFERDKAQDALHCELVNLGFADAHDAEHYAPREIEQGAGRGHSIRFMYTPPVPECVREMQGA